MKLFTHIDKALSKTADFLNSQTNKTAGWGEKADSWLKKEAAKTKEAADDLKNKTAETYDKVSEKAQEKYTEFKAENRAREEEFDKEEAKHRVTEAENVTVEVKETTPTPATVKEQIDNSPHKVEPIQTAKVYTLTELKQLAKEKGHTGYSKLSKKELLELLGL